MKQILLSILSVLLFAALLPAHGRAVVGAVDTDVNPDDAVVWLDGKALGTADDFDGWPSFLYLAPGEYTLEFRLEGYETFRATVHVAPWQVTRIEHQLVRVPPSVAAEPPPSVEEKEDKTAPPAAPEAQAPARLELTVNPDNAVVYMDGAVLISGADLARLHSPLQIPAGRHTLLCFAPGHEEITRELEAKPGELIEVDFVLVQKQ